MTEQPMTSGLLILPHLRVQNANAISSPLTWGFPAISAFVGLMQALERKLDGRFGLIFDSVGVICHNHQAQVTTGGFTRALHLTRNPVDAKGATAAIVEEGRIHLDITLIFKVGGFEQDGQPDSLLADKDERRKIARDIADVVAGMRIAGGSVLPGPGQYPQLLRLPSEGEERAKEFRRLRRRWVPGFALVSRDDLLASHTHTLRERDPAASALDAWLDLTRLQTRAVQSAVTDRQGEPREKIEWLTERAVKGWIVPIPVGYGALSPVYPAGAVANARDSTTPLCFVESLYSLGQWISPHRLNDVDELLWYPDSDTATGVYRCHNDYTPSTVAV